MKNIPWERLHALPTLQAREDRYIRRVMAICDGDVDKAVAVLGVARATLYRRVRELSIETSSQRKERIRVERALHVERLASREVRP